MLDEELQEALEIAVRNGDAEGARARIAAGADPRGHAILDLADEGRRRPLINIAAGGGFTPVLRALLEAGASPNSADALSTTAVDEAVSGCHFEAVQLLLSAGASPDGTAEMRDVAPTPSLRALRAGRPDILELLHAAGASRLTFLPKDMQLTPDSEEALRRLGYDIGGLREAGRRAFSNLRPYQRSVMAAILGYGDGSEEDDQSEGGGPAEDIASLKTRGMKTAEIAQAVGVTRRAVHSWMSGRAVPNETARRRLRELAGGRN